jgi:heterotetrameric sarcosine oxidase gamma subunit
MEPKNPLISQSAVLPLDHSILGKIQIQGQNAAEFLNQLYNLELGAGQGAVSGNSHIFRLREDIYWLIIPEGEIETTMAALAQTAVSFPHLITVTDYSHGRFCFQLSGPGSADLLSQLCGLDFHDSQFPNLTIKASSVAKTSQLILRHDQNGQLRYLLIGDRSLATYVWQTIMAALRQTDKVADGYSDKHHKH